MLFIFFFISLPSKFLTKPLRVLEDEVNKTNKQTKLIRHEIDLNIFLFIKLKLKGSMNDFFLPYLGSKQIFKKGFSQFRILCDELNKAYR